jgi:hypothetical protein
MAPPKKIRKADPSRVISPTRASASVSAPCIASPAVMAVMRMAIREPAPPGTSPAKKPDTAPQVMQ